MNANALARQVQEHVRKQPWSHLGDSPLPIELTFDHGREPERRWVVRFVVSVSGRYRRWSTAAGPTIGAALEAAREVQCRG